MRRAAMRMRTMHRDRCVRDELWWRWYTLFMYDVFVGHASEDPSDLRTHVL